MDTVRELPKRSQLAQKFISPTDLQAMHEKKYRKATRVRVVFIEGYSNGNFAPEFAAIEHPPVFGVGEIYDIPLELLDKIVRDGGFVAQDSETLLQYEPLQGKHRQKVKEWREEQAQLAKQKKAREDANTHNESILAEIEQLSREWMKSTGATKDALWQRITELRRTLR